MLVALQILLLATVGFFVVYLFMLSVLASFARRSGNATTTRQRRFAAVIPAHNEELTIAPTIQSLLQVDYPREYFDVVVIADNCSDGTAEVSRDSGAVVLERQNKELRGKGYALRWCFDKLLSQQGRYDAFVVVDADSVASANFLTVMNYHLEQGARVIQASDLVKPQPGAWSSEMTRLGFTLYNYVRPLGRRVIGCSAGLRGNGMCFAADVLSAHPWQAYSRAEDLEFGLHLLLQGIPVSFAPEASVLATMPQNPQLAESQRARWEGGRFPVIRRYTLPLLRNALVRGSFRSLDAFIDLVTPPLITLMGMVVGILLVTVSLSIIGATSALIFVYLWLGVFLLGFLHMFIGLYAAHADALLYKALFHLPRYTMWKAALLLKLVREDQTKEWIRTTREPVVAQEDSTKV
jgi:cellulose synthase/poly-beta-1,6-N-acetylglucosamine synthase-like glycosyltransferase